MFCIKFNIDDQDLVKLAYFFIKRIRLFENFATRHLVKKFRLFENFTKTPFTLFPPPIMASIYNTKEVTQRYWIFFQLINVHFTTGGRVALRSVCGGACWTRKSREAAQRVGQRRVMRQLSGPRLWNDGDNWRFAEVFRNKTAHELKSEQMYESNKILCLYLTLNQFQTHV